jgi:hypothetical protein
MDRVRGMRRKKERKERKNGKKRKREIETEWRERAKVVEKRVRVMDVHGAKVMSLSSLSDCIGLP